jgi:hypothetical protein
MSFKTGDRVKFLNDVGGGVITEFVDKKSVKVRTGDGFEIPVLVTELVSAVDENNFFQSGEDNSAEIPVVDDLIPEKAPLKELELEFDGSDSIKRTGEIFLAVIPHDTNNISGSDVELYLVNDSNYHIDFTVGYMEGGDYRLAGQGSLEPETKLFLQSFTQTGISKINKLLLQALFYTNGYFQHNPPVDMEFSTGNLSFYKESFYKENDYFEEKAIFFGKLEVDNEKEIIKISKEEIDKAIREKEQAVPAKEKKVKETDSGIEEVDLHIHEIVEDYAGLSNGEILQIQMDRFQTALEGAILHKTKKIVFIHGVGNGKLKHELRKALDTKFSGLMYQDASFKEYGFGATVVYIKQ